MNIAVTYFSAKSKICEKYQLMSVSKEKHSSLFIGNKEKKF